MLIDEVTAEVYVDLSSKEGQKK